MLNAARAAKVEESDEGDGNESKFGNVSHYKQTGEDRFKAYLVSFHPPLSLFTDFRFTRFCASEKKVIGTTYIGACKKQKFSIDVLGARPIVGD